MKFYINSLHHKNRNLHCFHYEHTASCHHAVTSSIFPSQLNTLQLIFNDIQGKRKYSSLLYNVRSILLNSSVSNRSAFPKMNVSKHWNYWEGIWKLFLPQAEVHLSCLRSAYFLYYCRFRFKNSITTCKPHRACETELDLWFYLLQREIGAICTGQ